MSKRNRSIKDKIDDCLDRCIQNLTTDKRVEMFDLLMSNLKLAGNVIRCKQFVVKTLNLPNNGKNTYKYWFSRGWSESESKYKYKSFNRELRKKKPRFSPFSKEFWMTKVNPQTNVNYTEDEALYEQHSRRPIRKEYWSKRGYSDIDAAVKANETKDSNNKQGSFTSTSRSKKQHRDSSHRCVEYWILRGYTIDEATEKVTNGQATFSLKKCIQKHGAEEGNNIWNERQTKWQNTINAKSIEELERIGRAKMCGGRGYSKVSQLLFVKIYELIKDKLPLPYFATMGRDGKIYDPRTFNKTCKLVHDEWFHISKNRVMMFFDFYIKETKSIIEFDGDYWHGEKRGNQERDTKRDATLLKEGFRLLRVKERDYKINPQKVIDECLKFLTQ